MILQAEGSHIDLSLQWLYSTDYITTLTPLRRCHHRHILSGMGRTEQQQPSADPVDYSDLRRLFYESDRGS